MATATIAAQPIQLTRTPEPATVPGRREVKLTPREADVLTLLAMGRSNAEIAEELFVSICTVKSHVRRLLTKMNRRDRLQLVVTAYTSGFMGERAVAPRPPHACHCAA